MRAGNFLAGGFPRQGRDFLRQGRELPFRDRRHEIKPCVAGQYPLITSASVHYWDTDIRPSQTRRECADNWQSGCASDGCRARNGARHGSHGPLADSCIAANSIFKTLGICGSWEISRPSHEPRKKTDSAPQSQLRCAWSFQPFPHTKKSTGASPPGPQRYTGGINSIRDRQFCLGSGRGRILLPSLARCTSIETPLRIDSRWIVDEIEAAGCVPKLVSSVSYFASQGIVDIRAPVLGQGGLMEMSSP